MAISRGIRYAPKFPTRPTSVVNLTYCSEHNARLRAKNSMQCQHDMHLPTCISASSTRNMCRVNKQICGMKFGTWAVVTSGGGTENNLKGVRNRKLFSIQKRKNSQRHFNPHKPTAVFLVLVLCSKLTDFMPVCTHCRS